MNASYWIEKLNLLPHPEGGYFKETYRCKEIIQPQGFNDNRNISTAIYFLLDGKSKSHLHRIKSDELWFFHEGATLEVLVIQENKLEIHSLGKNIDKGESLQLTVPAGCWFGARIKNQTGYALVSCTVAPGFDFRDFELAKKEEMKNQYSQYEEVMEEMCLS